MNDEAKIVATLLRKHRRSVIDEFDPLEFLKAGEVSLIHPECGGGTVKTDFRLDRVHLKCAFCEKYWSINNAKLRIAVRRVCAGQTTTVSVHDGNSGKDIGIDFQWEQ